MSVIGGDRQHRYRATDRWRRLIGMVATVALVTTPLCMGQHLLACRLATALWLDAGDHRLEFLGSVDREHLAQVVAFLVPVLEPHRPAGVVGRSSWCRWRAKSGVSPWNTTRCAGTARITPARRLRRCCICALRLFVPLLAVPARLKGELRPSRGAQQVDTVLQIVGLALYAVRTTVMVWERVRAWRRARRRARARR
jgi:hypothetical protein